MNKRAVALALVTVALALGLSAQAQQPSVPVVLEGGTNLDPCSVGMVKGLSADGDGFLAVRAGPGTSSAKLDELINGDRVLVCDERAGWFGVIYSKAERDCGFPSALPRSLAYAGPCPSGWVHSKWIEIIAG